VGKSWGSFSDLMPLMVLGGDRSEQFSDCIAELARVLVSLLPNACDKYKTFLLKL